MKDLSDLSEVTVYQANAPHPDEQYLITRMALHPLDGEDFSEGPKFPFRVVYLVQETNIEGDWHWNVSCRSKDYYVPPQPYLPDTQAALEWLLDGEE
jgi:hypothetical protein